MSQEALITTGIESKVLPIESPRELAQKLLLPELIRNTYRQPLPLDVAAIRRANKFRPGAVLVATTLDGMDEDFGLPDQEVLVPPGHPAFRKDPEINPGGEYGLGIFEGMRLIPIVRGGRVIGISIPLFEEKMARLEKSLNGRLIRERVSLDNFKQMIVTTAAANAKSALVGKDGSPSWAYIRPSVNSGDGPLGVKIGKDHVVRGRVVVFEWKDYVDVERAFKVGLTVAVSPYWQRTKPLGGKFSANYGEAGVVATLAREEADADEAIYFSWGVRDSNGEFQTVLAQEGEPARELLNQTGVFCDGPGEELVFLAGRTMIVLPPNYGQLEGTTLGYLKGPIAKNLGYEVVEGFVTPDDIRKGEVDGALFVGNAVTAVPIGEFIFYPGLPDKTAVPGAVSFPYLSPYAVELGQQLRGELTGQIWPPSGNNLHTFLNQDAGNVLRDTLMQEYKSWYLK